MLYQFMCDCRILISDVEHTTTIVTTAITVEGTMRWPTEGTTTLTEESNANSRIDSIPH